MMEYQRVADEQALAEEQLLSVVLADGNRVCLAKIGGQVYALGDRCSHAEYPLSEGSLGSDHLLECALHGAIFDVRDGSAQGPPADQPVMTYAVRIEDGGIWVGIED